MPLFIVLALIAAAKRLFSNTLTPMRRAPQYVRKVQAEGIVIAEKALWA